MKTCVLFYPYVYALTLGMCALASCSNAVAETELDRSRRETELESLAYSPWALDASRRDTMSASEIERLLREVTKRGRSFHRFGKRGRSFHRFGRGEEEPSPFVAYDKRGRSFHRFGRGNENVELNALSEYEKRGRSFHRFGKRSGDDLLVDANEADMEMS